MKKLPPIFSVLLVSLFTFFLLAQLPLPSLNVNEHPIFHKSKATNDDGEIIFISDTQEPIWIETLLLDRNKNQLATNLIFNEIIERYPSKVIHLGDIVAFGYKDEDWRRIDKYLFKFLQKGIEFYPTLGNHELLIFSEAGENKFNSRFPFYSKTGYSINNGSSEIILLNSNFSNMTNSEIAKQQEWYINKLIELEQDSSIEAVIVGCHHSPFTNSTIVDPNKKVEELFVPPFIESKKCKIFLSGHAHTFEHFKYNGKDFLVIGGGGGLQQPLYTGSESKYHDLYSSKSSKRMFHFISYRLENDTMHFTVKMLDGSFSKFNDEYEIKIPIGK